MGDVITIDLGASRRIDFAAIPAGEFLMGSPLAEDGREDDEGPQLAVRVTRQFHLGVCPVTRAQFARFVQDTGFTTQAETDGQSWTWEQVAWGQVAKASWREPGIAQGDDHPVVCVCWNDAVAFCEWLSRKSGWPIRLPTEAEWEYACRAGTDTAFNTGAMISTDQANYDGRVAYGGGPKGVFQGTTTPVDSFKPNAWGLFDMHGNAWEWCSDWQDKYSQQPVADPAGPAKALWRVLRGGCWINGPRVCRSASRGGGEPAAHSHYFGFRIAVG